MSVARVGETPAPARLLRVLFVNSIRAYGGGEKWALETARGLARRGHQIAFTCRDGSELAGLARTEGMPVFLSPLPNDVSPLTLLRLAGHFRSWRPDVLLCCNQRAMRLGAPAARLAGVPRVVMRDGLIGSLSGTSYNRWISRLVDGFVVNANATRRELTGWLPADRVRVIYNGIDLRPYDETRGSAGIRNEVGCPPNACVVLCVARLVQEKDHATLLTAFQRAMLKRERLHLWIVGDGPLRPLLEAQVERQGLARNVSFLGFRGDVPRLLAGSDLLAIASQREGLPNVALEAMAARRPVIATAIAGTPELVRDGETGILVPPGAPEALAGALTALAGDPIRRRQMGESGRRRVEKWFESTRALDQWEQYLIRLVG